MDIASFHKQTAEHLQAFYGEQEDAPQGWLEALMWHWEQAGKYGEALNVALAGAERYIAELNFTEARRWIERSFALLDRLPDADRLSYGFGYEARYYALIIAVLEFEGQFREALGYAQLFLRLAEIHGNIEAQGRSYVTIGRVHRELGQLVIAESDLMRALKLAERHQMPELEWEARFHLAKVHQLQGRHLEALQQLDLAHRGATEAGADERLARVCTGIGDVYRVLGSGHDALRFYHQALKTEIASSNRLGQAMLYEKLGLSHVELAEFYEAQECMQESLRLRKELGDNLGQARAHSIMGTIQSRLKDYTRALEHYEKARELEAGLQNRRGQTIALTNLGDVARETSNYEQALVYFQEALTLTKGIGDQVGMTRIYERMGDVAVLKGNAQEAREFWGQALHIRDDMGHYDEAQELRERLKKLQAVE
jgi:tetratricopeptide (TPR) repeat protein